MTPASFSQRRPPNGSDLQLWGAFHLVFPERALSRWPILSAGYKDYFSPSLQLSIILS
jgi:hypothetical protein